MQAAERITTGGDEAQPVSPAGGAAPIRTQNDETHMSDDLEAMAQQLRVVGDAAHKPAPYGFSVPSVVVFTTRLLRF